MYYLFKDNHNGKMFVVFAYDKDSAYAKAWFQTNHPELQGEVSGHYATDHRLCTY